MPRSNAPVSPTPKTNVTRSPLRETVRSGNTSTMPSNTGGGGKGR